MTDYEFTKWTSSIAREQIIAGKIAQSAAAIDARAIEHQGHGADGQAAALELQTGPGGDRRRIARGA